MLLLLLGRRCCLRLLLLLQLVRCDALAHSCQLLLQRECLERLRVQRLQQRGIDRRLLRLLLLRLLLSDPRARSLLLLLCMMLLELRRCLLRAALLRREEVAEWRRIVHRRHERVCRHKQQGGELAAIVPFAPIALRWLISLLPTARPC